MLLSRLSKHSMALSASLLLTLVSSSGCSTLVWNKQKSQFDTTALKTEGYDVRSLGSQSALAALPASNKPSIVLEVHHNGRHMERIPLPTDRPWFVQDLINEAEIQKRIGVTRIQIIRTVGPAQPPLVLDVPVSADGKDINAGQNYSLCPGDLVVVKANNITMLERMVPAYFRGGEK